MHQRNVVKFSRITSEALQEALWYFWIVSRPRAGLWSGIWRWMKSPRGQSMCESYDPGFRPSHWQTKADWKQRLAVYYFCWGASVRNSPLICFILFYEAVTPNRVRDGSAELFLRVPPLGAPCPFSRYRSCCRDIQYVYLTNTVCICSGAHTHIQLSKERRAQLKSGGECLTPTKACCCIMLVQNLNVHCF